MELIKTNKDVFSNSINGNSAYKGEGTPVKSIAFKLTKKLKWGSTLVKIPQNMFVHCTCFKVSWRR